MQGEKLRLGVIVGIREEGFLGEIEKVRDFGLPTCQVCSWNPEVFTDENAGIIREAPERYGVEATTVWAGYPGPAKWNFTEGPSTIGLVPPEYRNELLQRTYDQALVAGRCRSIPIGSDIVRIPTINETSRLDGGRAGGILAYWKDEGELKVPTKPAFGQVELRLKKLIGLCYATDELLQDSAISLDALLGDLFAQEIGFKIDDAIINGTGVGMPLGLLAAPATVTVAKEAAQPAATLLAQNIIKMWARMWSRSRSNAVWFINQDIEPQLYTMSLAVGTGGLPVYLPPNGLSGAPFGTLYGRPVLPIEQCSTLGTVGDIILADMSQYILATRGGIQAATSIHVNFVYDETAFRFVIRVDGQPWWNSPLTPYKGGAANSTSPFVVLATRA